MPKIKSIIITLVLVMAFIFMNNLGQNYETAESNNPDIQLKQEPPTTKTQQSKNQPVVNENTNADEINPKPIITTFDIDPIVDNEIIEEKFKYCSNLLYFLKENKHKNNINYGFSTLKIKRPDFYENYLNYCKKINVEHPEYGLDKEKKLENIYPSTYLGRLMSDEKFAEYEFEHNQDAIKNAFINADPNLLLSYYSMVTYFKFFPDLEFTLGSQQHDYRAIIGKYAQILFACRLGADCGEFSSIVFQKCMINHDMCANNIEELIKTKFSIGQQADIELGYQHLVDYYNTQE